jgi:hypothetical protein
VGARAVRESGRGGRARDAQMAGDEGLEPYERVRVFPYTEGLDFPLQGGRGARRTRIHDCLVQSYQ